MKYLIFLAADGSNPFYLRVVQGGGGGGVSGTVHQQKKVEDHESRA